MSMLLVLLILLRFYDPVEFPKLQKMYIWDLSGLGEAVIIVMNT